jgi:hypothetical protein
MKERPGVFTGEEGAFVVYESKRGGPFWKRSQEKSEEAADKREQAASGKTPEATQIAAGEASKETQVTPEAAKEFQEFQEWKQEQKEFREFQEWKEWKSYQEWKKQQGQ